MTAPQLATKDLRRVVIAAAVGNVIEWYDFYIFGSLAALLSVKFFAAGASGSALIKTVGTFTAGFLIRPFGAFVFGRIGDIVGRKYTFLITLSGMGLATADRKSTRLNSSHSQISYAVFCLKKKKRTKTPSGRIDAT